MSTRPAWRRLRGTLGELGRETLIARQRELARELAETGAPGWRCDPLPLLLDEAGFGRLAAGLAQRARVLEAVLADVYGPRRLLEEGVLPAGMLATDPAWLRPCAIDPPSRQLHWFAADLVPGADGAWRVAAHLTDAPSGLLAALENRRLLGRSLPELFGGQDVAPLGPFLEAWRGILCGILAGGAASRSAPGGTGEVALLTGGPAEAAWAEHRVLARALSCALVEDSDLTVRGGALFLKTLRVLQPIGVLLRGVPGVCIDMLEMPGGVEAGVPGLLAAARMGRVAILNAPGAGFAQSPGLTPYLPALCRMLLDEDLLLEDAAPGDAPPAPVACLAENGRVIEGAARLRLFLVADGPVWRALPGGTATVLGPGPAAIKDVWVLSEEAGFGGSAASGTGARLAIRRASGDLPSRVAEDFFWLGRTVERLEHAGRLLRALARRMGQPAPLPHEMREMVQLVRCLQDAHLVGEETTARAGPTILAALLRRDLAAEEGFSRLCADIARLTSRVGDRLTDDMRACLLDGLRAIAEARAAGLDRRGDLGPVEALADRTIEFAAAIAGRAAENMVRGGVRLFLDLGRRIERTRAVSLALARMLDQHPARIEAGLLLALELCDSVLTYRQRYLTTIQPAAVLDLLAADPANPRGLAFQLVEARAMLALLADAEDPGLAPMLDPMLEAIEAVVQAIGQAPEPAVAASAAPARLRAIAEAASGVSEAIGRRYFTLLPPAWRSVA